MDWDRVAYKSGQKQLVLTIISMVDVPDLVIVPSINTVADSIDFSLVEELVVLLDKIPWRRELQLFEMSVTPQVYPRGFDPIPEGSFADTTLHAGFVRTHYLTLKAHSPQSKSKISISRLK